MSSPGSDRFPRWLVIALLAATGLALGVRPVGATGCHATDRPTLGLSFTRERPIGLGWPSPPPHHDPVAPKFVPRPCTGDVPSSPGRAEWAGAGATLVPGEASLAPRSSRRAPLDSDPPPPDPVLSRLDRPPRATA